MADSLQHKVAGVVAQRIVHPFEPVEVHQQYRDFSNLPLRPGALFLEEILKHLAVGQAGQRIIKRDALDFLLVQFALGDVLNYANDCQLAAFYVAQHIGPAIAEPILTARAMITKLQFAGSAVLLETGEPIAKTGHIFCDHMGKEFRIRHCSVLKSLVPQSAQITRNLDRLLPGAPLPMSDISHFGRLL